jgi:hypothetical protein
MKKYIPPKRLVELGLVLQYDTEQKPTFNTNDFEREMINQERAKLFAGDYSYMQTEKLENKIQTILLEIQKQNWKPKKEIQYD